MTAAIAPLGATGSRPPLARALSAVGAVVIAVLLVRGAPGDPGWATAAGLLATAMWAATTALPARAPTPLRAVLLVATLIPGSLAAAPTEVTGYVPALVVVVSVVALPGGSPLVAGAVPLTAALLLAVGALLGGSASGVLLACVAALVVAVVVGLSRRQARAAEDRLHAVLEERVALAEERARSAALTERTRIARDLHDVLAHSLGGLVLQLDAVDALLAADRRGEAAARVVAARDLAAAGLDEARRAVEALREPDEAADLPAALAELVAVHRSLGGTATLTVTGTAGPLRPEIAGALRRAAQEILSNARSHAPGATTRLESAWLDDEVHLDAVTPLVPGARAAPGTGRGLPGLRDRCRELGGDADWRVSDDAFAVSMRLPR